MTAQAGLLLRKKTGGLLALPCPLSRLGGCRRMSATRGRGRPANADPPAVRGGAGRKKVSGGRSAGPPPRRQEGRTDFQASGVPVALLSVAGVCAPATGRRKEEAARTRAALLDAALDVMSTRGVYSARIEDITEAAAVAKGSFYVHFQGKDEVLAAVLRKIFEDLLVCLQDSARRQKGPRSRVESLVDAHLQLFARHPGRLVVMHQARGIVMLNQEKFPAAQKALAVYLTLMEQALREGGAQPVDAHVSWVAAQLVAALINGFLSVKRATHRGWLNPRDRAVLYRAAWAAVAPLLRQGRVD